MRRTEGPCLDVALLVDQQVLRLEISVDEVQGVKVFKRQYNLGCVEAGVRFAVEKKNRLQKVPMDEDEAEEKTGERSPGELT